MKGWTYAKHLMHRRCDRCYHRGFYDAVMLVERKDGLLRNGYSEEEAEALLRIRLAAR